MKPPRNTDQAVDSSYGARFDKAFGVNDEFKAYVRDLPCLVCGANSDPHHVRTRGAGGKDNANLVPLCREHHQELHTIGVLTFEDKYKLGCLRMRAEQLFDKYEGAKE